MYQVEDTYWWYTGLRKLVFLFMLESVHEKKRVNLLDTGCGTGRMLSECGEYRAFGVDISEEALKFCRLRNLKNILRGSICDLPFKDKSFHIVISLDVLYHLKVSDDFRALREIYRVTDEDGVLLLNLPAYDFLKSTHDKMIHTKQRYTLRNLKAKVEKAGFIIERVTYRNTLLFPMLAFTRIMKKIRLPHERKIESDVKPLPAMLNKFLERILAAENRLITSGLNFPFGLSVFCVARKK